MLVLSFAIATPESADAASTRPCAPRGAALAAVGGQAQVFYARGGRLFACHRRTRRVTDLQVMPSREIGLLRYDRARSIRVAGPFVGFSRETELRGELRGSVQVLDSRTGRYKRSVPQRLSPPYGSFSGPAGDFLPATVTDLELNGLTGAAGWIARVGYPEFLGYEVRRADSRLGKKVRSDSTVLDSAPDIDPNSLVLTRDLLSWERGEAVVTTSQEASR